MVNKSLLFSGATIRRVADCAALLHLRCHWDAGTILQYSHLFFVIHTVAVS